MLNETLQAAVRAARAPPEGGRLERAPRAATLARSGVVGGGLPHVPALRVQRKKDAPRSSARAGRSRAAEDIIRVEKKFYGDWSPETRQLLADGDALAAYKRRAFDLYRRRFAPEALLRRVDAWNERGAPDGWQDKST